MSSAVFASLDLPEPPSPNDLHPHPKERIKQKNGVRRKTWQAAISQRRPVSDPPDPVLIRAHFRLHNLRDPADNLPASLKYVLDALRLPSEGDRLHYRGGLYERKGYFVDDSPKHLVIDEVTQEIDRSDRGLTLKIVDLAALSSSPDLTGSEV